MSLISGKTGKSANTSILKSFNTSSRDRVKSMVTKVHFETDLERNVANVLEGVEKNGDLQKYERFLNLLRDERFDVS